MNKKGKALTGMSPKCLQTAGKAYISATGEMWPCCWLYERRKDLHDWASRNGFSMDSINLKLHTSKEITQSEFMTEFQKSFDTPTCRKECSKDSWTYYGNSKRNVFRKLDLTDNKI